MAFVFPGYLQRQRDETPNSHGVLDLLDEDLRTLLAVTDDEGKGLHLGVEDENYDVEEKQKADEIEMEEEEEEEDEENVQTKKRN